MNRTPKQGEPYQVCIHLAADTGRSDRHYWQVPSRDPWIVLCDGCHGSFSKRQSVEIHGELFRLAEDVVSAPGSSCVEHSRPDVILADLPPVAEKSPTQLLTFLPRVDWMPLVDRSLSTLAELVRSAMAQASSRADAEIRRLEVETQGMERMLRLVDASVATIERLQSLAAEQDAVIVEMIRRVRDEWRWQAPSVLDAVAGEFRKGRRKPARRRV